MVYNVEERKRRHTMSQTRYQDKRKVDTPGACFWSGCKEAREEKEGKLLNYCKAHLIDRAAYQRSLYRRMLESKDKQVRVTEKPA